MRAVHPSVDVKIFESRLEDTMYRSILKSGTLIALVTVLVTVTPACQPSATSPPVTNNSTQITSQPADNLMLKGDGFTKIEKIVVRRGETTEFKVQGGVSYVLIPDEHLLLVGEQGEVPASGGVLAFKVDANGAKVKVPADYPKSHENIDIYYSVLCFDKDGNAYYAEGDSPPRMQIPPTR
jgi:hypothetical protein